MMAAARLPQGAEPPYIRDLKLGAWVCWYVSVCLSRCLRAAVRRSLDEDEGFFSVYVQKVCERDCESELAASIHFIEGNKRNYQMCCWG